MLNRYPVWKNFLVIAVTLAGLLLALPNIFGEDPAVQIYEPNSPQISQQALDKVKTGLAEAKIPFKSVATSQGRALVRFSTNDQQLKAQDAIKKALGEKFVVALNLAPRTPAWLRALGLKPMSKGLDLRGGVHFLMQVDMKAAIDQAVERNQNEIRGLLREKRIRYLDVSRDGQSVKMVFRSEADQSTAEDAILRTQRNLDVNAPPGADKPTLVATIKPQQLQEIRTFAVEQNITTLRNRVNELGVSEPIVQRQGQDRIVVELPGVQDTARAKDILGATATLEFHMVDETANPIEAEKTGHVPLGDKLYKNKQGAPVLLKREVIVTGDQLTNALSGYDSQSGGPDVVVSLDDAGARRMGETTRANLNKLMAVVFIETKTETRKQNGKEIKLHHKVETVINQATIRGIFSSRFQITGLGREEAKNLALLLRAGALAAPVDIVEERTVGPSLGQENINQGFSAAVLGMALVVVFMAVYYKVFGILADIALLMNVVLTVGLLSLIQATLTLPGIAGIVLTVGMAVDANVLIYERIREELRNGNTPQASIHAGYERAFGTIFDSNITTLIAALVLFMFGTGPVKGFAVTLSLGIVTSMFTAIMGTRAIVNVLYGGRKVSHLPV